MTALTASDLEPRSAPLADARTEARAPADETEERSTPRNLAPVIEVVPPSCYVNPVWKGLAYVARDIVVYAAILASIALTDRWYFLVPLFVLSAFIVSGLFILGHDAAHGALFQSKRLNNFIGRLTMLPSLHVYESWVFGHNRLHHGHTARQGADFVWHPITVEDWGKLSKLQRLLVRFEWSWLGAGIYYTRNIWLKMIRWEQPPSLAEKVHRDQMIVYAWLLLASAGAAWFGHAHYGSALGAAWMTMKLVVIPAFLFMYVMAVVVYMHHIEPDIRWYPRGKWDKFKGQMEATTNLRLPFGFDLIFHNITIHVPHHVDMRIPFYHLPEAAKAITAAYPDVVREGRFSLIDYFRTTKSCKLYDFENGRWSSSYPD